MAPDFVPGQSVRVQPFYDRPARRQVVGFDGTVWSTGPARGTWWVTPAGSTTAVACPSSKLVAVQGRAA